MFFSLLIGLGELIVRFTTHAGSNEYGDKSLIDDELGWYPKENFELSTRVTDINDNTDTVLYSTQDHGFRKWGNIETEKHKILFIGDSYTQAVEVASSDAYYSIIGDSLDCEIFAFGQAGYGTIQELMILKKYIKFIDPDLVVLQVCDNDYIDNYYKLELESNYKVGLRRPYMDLEGNIYYRRPVSDLREILGRSKFIDLILRKIKYGLMNQIKDPTEKKISEMGDAYEDYRISKQLTDMAIKNMKEELNGTPFLIFSASSFEPQMGDFKTIAEDQAIGFNASAINAVNELKGSMTLHSKDGYHWIKEGHRIIGHELIPSIVSLLEIEENNE